MPLPCNKPRKSPGTDHPVPGRIYHAGQARSDRAQPPSRPQGNQQDANSRGRSPQKPSAGQPALLPRPGAAAPKSRPQDYQHCCCYPGAAAPQKAVRRTAIVPAGFAGGAGRFSLCEKHSLHSRTAGRRACAPTSERVQKIPGMASVIPGSAKRISTCRPCRRRQREPQARERECPPPGIRWSAPSQPRRRRSAAQNGSPWWDR